jgi:hypothetical protein
MARAAKASSALIAVTIVAAAVAQESLVQRGKTAPVRGNTAAVLNQVMPDVTFTDTPLETVMNWLGDITHLNIVPHWQTLEDAGLKRDKQISIQAHNLPLTQVLWLIMSEAGGSDLKLAYRASGNLLVFSTADDLNKEMITKVYDVADLLIRVPMATHQSVFDVTQGMGQNGGGVGGGGGGSSGGMFQQGNSNQYNSGNQQDSQQASEATMEKLMTLIRDVVEPDTWRENGGNGSISAYQKTIIVRNTILVHQRLGGYVSEDE